jgi:hypothetical protein
MAALTAQRWNPAIRAFSQRLKNAGKRNKVILTACMRKLLIILNTMVKNQTPGSTTTPSQPLDNQHSRSAVNPSGRISSRVALISRSDRSADGSLVPVAVGR